MSKIAIFGGASFVGQHLRRFFGPRRCISTYHRTRFDGGIPFDVTDTENGEFYNHLVDVTHAVILLGNTDLEACARNPSETELTNVVGISRLILKLTERNIKPVFISTDNVFDGEKGCYLESDSVRPLVQYAVQKVAVEIFLQTHVQNYLILRLGKVYATGQGEKSFLASLLHSIANGEDVRCAVDQIFSPILVDDVAKCIELLIATQANGIVHVAGPQALSRLDLYDLAYERVTRELVLADRKVEYRASRCSLSDLGLSEVRPKDTSLAIDRLLSITGFKPGAVSDYLDLIPLRE